MEQLIELFQRLLLLKPQPGRATDHVHDRLRPKRFPRSRHTSELRRGRRGVAELLRVAREY